MTPTMHAALAAACAGPLVKGRAGWLREGDLSGFSTRTIEALFADGCLTLEKRSRNMNGWGDQARITDYGRAIAAKQ